MPLAKIVCFGCLIMKMITKICIYPHQFLIPILKAIKRKQKTILRNGGTMSTTSVNVGEVPPDAESDQEHALRMARLAMSNQRAYWFRR